MTYNKKTSQGTHLFIEALPPVHVVQNTQQSNKPTQPRIGWPPHHTTGVQVPTLFEQSCGFFNFPQEPDEWKSCETEPYSFLSLSGKTRKSNCLQKSLQRTFLVSYLKTLRVGLAGVCTRDLPLSRPALSQLNSYKAVNWVHVLVRVPRFF